MTDDSTNTGGLLPTSLNVRNNFSLKVRCRIVRIWRRRGWSQWEEDGSTYLVPYTHKVGVGSRAPLLHDWSDGAGQVGVDTATKTSVRADHHKQMVPTSLLLHHLSFLQHSCSTTSEIPPTIFSPTHLEQPRRRSWLASTGALLENTWQPTPSSLILLSSQCSSPTSLEWTLHSAGRSRGKIAHDTH